MKIWVDDVREAPEGYVHIRTANCAKKYIRMHPNDIEEVSLDHDAGMFAGEGGDYIEILKELERLTHVHKMDFSNISFRLHSANSVGVQNMRAIIQRNAWKELR